MRIRLRRKPQRKRRRGAVMIEMAIVLPVFLALLLGMIELGQALMISQLVTNSAREGARQGIFDGSTNAAVEQSVKDFLIQAVNVGGNTDLIEVTITVTPAAGNEDPLNVLADANRRDLVSVRVEIPFNNQVSYITPIFLEDIPIVGQSSMRHE